MSGESFEWAIKKDVRNNPIVREVDLERHRDMWRSVGISVFLVVVLLFSAWQKFGHLNYGYDIERIQKERAEAAATRRALRLEIEQYRSPAWIESVATEQLRMVAPGPTDVIVIERLVEPEAPPKSVVARR